MNKDHFDQVRAIIAADFKPSKINTWMHDSCVAQLSMLSFSCFHWISHSNTLTLIRHDSTHFLNGLCFANGVILSSNVVWPNFFPVSILIPVVIRGLQSGQALHRDHPRPQIFPLSLPTLHVYVQWIPPVLQFTLHSRSVNVIGIMLQYVIAS